MTANFFNKPANPSRKGKICQELKLQKVPFLFNLTPIILHKKKLSTLSIKKEKCFITKSFLAQTYNSFIKIIFLCSKVVAHSHSKHRLSLISHNSKFFLVKKNLGVHFEIDQFKNKKMHIKIICNPSKVIKEDFIRNCHYSISSSIEEKQTIKITTFAYK